ncbi:MAG: DUF4214 domain-containing protein [Desulfobacterales bacterium]|nr:DUF4214 domain-containing protein [Desulfobacterales bacterium]
MRAKSAISNQQSAHSFLKNQPSLKFLSYPVLLYLLLLSLVLNMNAYAGLYVLETQWGIGPSDGQFSYPRDVAVDASGNIYVADSENNRVQKFDSTGKFISQWKTNYSALSIAIDSSGNIYVGGIGEYFIQKYDSNQQLLAKWGSNSEYQTAYGISFDSSGNVYVADSNPNHIIKKFNSNGELITKWGSQGSDDGQFNFPNDIAVDLSSGSVYVADGYNMRVQKFDSNGNFLTKWQSANSPNGISVDASGYIYLMIGSGKIVKYDSNGQIITEFGSSGSEDGQFSSGGGLTVDSSGNIFVADSSNNRIQKLTSAGQFNFKIENKNYLDGQFLNLSDIAVSSDGFVYVTDNKASRVQKFDSNGTFLAKWGTYGSDDGQFKTGLPLGITIDSSGNVYITDGNNYRIQKFDSNGNFSSIKLSGSPGQFFPDKIAFDSLGYMYVFSLGKFNKYDYNGNLLTSWGSMGSGDSQYGYWGHDFDVDSLGYVYVADRGNHSIKKFDSEGNFITKWGDGQYDSPDSIALDSVRNMYVSNNDKIQKLDTKGQLITQWEASTTNIAVDSSGNVYITDSTNCQIKKYRYTESSTTTYTVTFTAGSGGQITGETTQTITSGGSSSAVTATPDSGYEFTGWTGDYTGTNNPLTLTNVTANMNITANFSSLTKVPSVTTGSAASILQSSATLSGSVNPNGLSTTYYFEYGPTTSYGSTTTSTVLGSGSSAMTVTAQLSGLSAVTTYNYRLVASNSLGTTTGNNATFKTRAASVLSNRLFVEQVYKDFFGRNGDSEGINFWAAGLDSGFISPSDMVKNFYDSPEFQSSKLPVVTLYLTSNTQIPDSGIVSNTGLSFISSSTNEEFAKLLYQKVLGREPDEGGLNYWIAALDGGMSRQEVLNCFSGSTEYKTTTVSSDYKAVNPNKIQTLLLYLGMFGRMPTQTELDTAVAQLDSGSSVLELIDGLLVANDYKNRMTLY